MAMTDENCSLFQYLAPDDLCAIPESFRGVRVNPTRPIPPPAAVAFAYSSVWSGWRARGILARCVFVRCIVVCYKK